MQQLGTRSAAVPGRVAATVAGPGANWIDGRSVAGEGPWVRRLFNPADTRE